MEDQMIETVISMPAMAMVQTMTKAFAFVYTARKTGPVKAIMAKMTVCIAEAIAVAITIGWAVITLKTIFPKLSPIIVLLVTPRCSHPLAGIRIPVRALH